ncbi:ABC transporter permease [Aequorivita aurantiaca]|uniref:ABC transporter permease n=1 Tax=Aequorivita aurantiaca TaxID=3053356 RepID=UPI00338EEDF3
MRNIRKNQGYSILNITGLALGITSACLIFLWVENETNFDSSIPDQERVFYVPINQKYKGEWQTFHASPGPLAAALKKEIPEVNKAGRLVNANLLFKVGDNIINSNGHYADTDIFEIFGLSFIEGNAKTAFENLNSIVITEETAEKLFGTVEGIVGKSIFVNNSPPLQISGVIEDSPANVTYKFSWLCPFQHYSKENSWTQTYDNNFVDTFVKLIPGADRIAVDNKVRDILPLLTQDNKQEAFLHSSKDWHLRSKFQNGVIVGGAIEFVQLFSLIAIIILLIACINFMNLATARSEKKANEVGVRKALGSSKKILIAQFLTESMMTASMAAGVAVLLLYLLLPYFNNLVERDLTIGFNEPAHLIFLIGITLVCGIFAGLYPAFYLSSFKPLDIFKRINKPGGSAVSLRKGLIVTQFIFSIVFIISTLIVFLQIQHIKSRDLGFNKENVVQIPVNGNIIKNYNSIEEDMFALGLVQNVSMNSSEIFSSGSNGSGLSWQGGIETEDVLIRYRWITSNFIETLGMEIVEGRNFSNNSRNDSLNIIITQSFAKLMGPGSAVGRIVTADKNYTVIGVVKDYVYGDIYGPSQPVMFLSGLDEASFLYVRLKPGIPQGMVLGSLQKVLKRHNPAFPFEYTFVDRVFQTKFKREILISKLSQIFALIAILISCLGLFGLSAFTAEQRKKEIGIRKTLGSSVLNIWRLLFQEFLFLILIAIIIAVPIAYLLLSQWLQGFAYRIDMNFWVFIIAGAIAILIALLTISFHAVKAAKNNPSNNLRTE